MTRYPRSGKGRKWTVLELKAVPAAWVGDLLSDGDGLSGEVRATAEGGVSIRFRYGFKWLGKKAWHYCGSWPAASMEAVRAERDQSRKLVKSGMHPGDVRKAAKIAAQQHVESVIAAEAARKVANRTLRDLVGEWLPGALHKRTAVQSRADLERTFNREVLPVLGDMPVRDVRGAHLQTILAKVGIDRGKGRTAQRMYSDLRQCFRWAMKQSEWRRLMADEGNPVESIDKALTLPTGYKTVRRKRVLSSDELRQLRDAFAAMERDYADTPEKQKYSTRRPIKCEHQLAMWICLSTACRIGELSAARWANVDLEAATWFVPAGDTKTNTEWMVFLSPFALRQFKALRDCTGHTPYLFPSRPKGRRREQGVSPVAPEGSIGPAVISKQIGDRQMRFKSLTKGTSTRAMSDALVLAGGANGEWTPHDLRRTAATMMQGLGIPLDHIDLCLNHKLPGASGVRGHYNLHQYEGEKRDAWLKLGAQLDSVLAAGKDSCNGSEKGGCYPSRKGTSISA